MDIFATQPYRISPLAKREFSERQRFGHAVEKSTHFIEPPEKKTSPHDREVRAYQAAYVAIGDPHKQLQNAGITRPFTPANPVVTSHTIAAQGLQMAAIARIEITKNGRATSGFFKASAAAQYQRLERETNPGIDRLSEYA